MWHLSLKVRTNAPPAPFRFGMNPVISVSLYYEVPIISCHNTFGCLASLIGNYFFGTLLLHT